MEFAKKFWIQLIVYAVSFAAAWDGIQKRIKSLKREGLEVLQRCGTGVQDGRIRSVITGSESAAAD